MRVSRELQTERGLGLPEAVKKCCQLTQLYSCHFLILFHLVWVSSPISPSALFFLPSSVFLYISVCFLCGAQHYNILTVCIDRQAPRTAFNLTSPLNPDPIEHTHTLTREDGGSRDGFPGGGVGGRQLFYTTYRARKK